MKPSENKVEYSMVSLIALMFICLGYLLSHLPAGSKKVLSEIVYEMPRPTKSLLSFIFDLRGREVDRQFTALTKKSIPTDLSNKVQAPPLKALDPKNAAKKDTSKDKKKTANKTKKVDIQVVNNKNDKNESQFEKAVLSQEGFLGPAAPSVSKNTNKEKDTADTNNKNKRPASALRSDNDAAEVEVLTEGQWRSLLSAQPNNENLQKLMEAYRKNQINEEGYLAIVSDLFNSNNPELQKLGLTGATGFYTPQTFIVVSHNLDRLLTADQKVAQDYLNTYGQKDRLGLLATVLQNSDIQALNQADRIILTSYQLAKSNLSKDPQSTQAQLEVQSFSQFVEIYKGLSSSTDVQIASLADAALKEIQVAKTQVTKLAKK
ncbi:MAG: hypothetical protein ACOYOK_09405 [Pseudobdellovibrionaceae bacterium]